MALILRERINMIALAKRNLEVILDDRAMEEYYFLSSKSRTSFRLEKTLNGYLR